MALDRRFFLLLAVSIAASLILFSGSLNGQFTLDDHSVIEKGVQLKSLKNLPGIWISPWHPGGQWAGNYRPLTSVSFALNLLFSESPAGFRVANALLFALNVVFIFYLVRRISTEKIAYLTAVIFLFLPIHSEAVMSIVGRVYLLGTIFSLASLYYFLGKKYWASSGFFLLALFSGDIFISLILVVGAFLLIEYKSLTKAFKCGMIYTVGLPIYFLFRYLALGQYAFGGYGFINPTIGPLAFVSLKERVFTALAHLYLYLRKTIYPVDLSPDYSFNQIPVVSNLFLSWRSLAGLAFLALLVYLFFKSKRKEVKFAVVLFTAPYLIISNIFFVTTGTMAERWWYFPSFGLIMLAAIGIGDFVQMLKTRFLKFPAAKLISGLGIAVLGWYALILFGQNKVWLNDQNLFIYAAERSPNSVWARTNLAEGYFLSGEAEKAEKEIKAALEISDEYPLTLYVLGQIHWKEGRFDEAEDAFKRAIEFDVHGRNKRSFYRSMALVNLDIGNNKQALVYMWEAVKWPPAGDLEKILKVDEVLLKKIEEYSDRDIRSYSQEEIQELGQMIKILRGF